MLRRYILALLASVALCTGSAYAQATLGAPRGATEPADTIWRLPSKNSGQQVPEPELPPPAPIGQTPAIEPPPPAPIAATPSADGTASQTNAAKTPAAQVAPAAAKSTVPPASPEIMIPAPKSQPVPFPIYSPGPNGTTVENAQYGPAITQFDHTVDHVRDAFTVEHGAFKIIPFGSLRGDALYATNTVTARAFPLYLNPFLGVSVEEFTISGQATELGAEFLGPNVGSFRTGGRVLVNFAGDIVALNEQGIFFYEGFGELYNDNWRFAFGQQRPVISPLDPIMVAYFTNFAAGNLGGPRGQFRVERHIAPTRDLAFLLQGAISQQFVDDFIADPREGGSDNGWPNLEARIAAGIGDLCSDRRPIEIGISGLLGQTRAMDFFRRPLPRGGDTWAFGLDLRAETETIGFRGEFFVGQGIGTYTGAIAQSVNTFTGQTIESVGGWTQVWYRVFPSLLVSIGYGVDDPRNGDLNFFQRSRNELIFGNAIWDFTRHFQMGFEVGYRETDYVFPARSATGMVYQFMSRLRY